MDKKKLTIIAVVIVIIIIALGIGLSMNTTKDTNPQHIVIADSNNHGEPDNGFDALTGWGSGHSNHNTLIYSTLFKTDENGTIINDLATNYTISSDGLIWTVNIRDDVKFSNNKTLDAEDVAFSFNTAKNSSTELDLTNLNYAKAIDNYTIEFHLNESRSTFIYDLRYLGIVSAEDYNNETYGSNPIGSGPYILKEWDRGQQAIFTINENYYGEKPYFTQITLLFPDEASSLELVKSGEVDVISAPFNGLNETVEGYDKVNLSAGRAQGISLPYLPNNGTTSDDGDVIGNNVTSDINIRKALNIGINRSEIVDSVYSGYGHVEYSGVDSRDYGNTEAAVEDGYIESAKDILDAAGWKDSDGDGIREKNGTKASFELYYPSENIDRQSVSLLFSEQAKELGIEVELVGTDWDTIYTKMYSQAVFWQQSSQNPYTMIYQQYHSKTADDSYMNPNLYNNSEVDSILHEAVTTTDSASANSLWSKAAYTGDGGFGPSGDAPWVWISTFDYVYFVAEDVNITNERPDNYGNDLLINIEKWSRN